MTLKPDSQLDDWRATNGYEMSEPTTITIKQTCFGCDGSGQTGWDDGDPIYCHECCGDGYTEHLVPIK